MTYSHPLWPDPGAPDNARIGNVAYMSVSSLPILEYAGALSEEPATFSRRWSHWFRTVSLSASFNSKVGTEEWLVAFRLYRGPLLVIQFLFLLGINVYGWRSSGVNHVLIFEMDPRNHLSEQHIMELAAIFGVVWALSALGKNLSIIPNCLCEVFHLLLSTFRRQAERWRTRY